VKPKLTFSPSAFILLTEEMDPTDTLTYHQAQNFPLIPDNFDPPPKITLLEKGLEDVVSDINITYNPANSESHLFEMDGTPLSDKEMIFSFSSSRQITQTFKLQWRSKAYQDEFHSIDGYDTCQADITNPEPVNPNPGPEDDYIYNIIVKAADIYCGYNGENFASHELYSITLMTTSGMMGVPVKELEVSEDSIKPVLKFGMDVPITIEDISLTPPSEEYLRGDVINGELTFRLNNGFELQDIEDLNVALGWEYNDNMSSTSISKYGINISNAVENSGHYTIAFQMTVSSSQWFGEYLFSLQYSYVSNSSNSTRWPLMLVDEISFPKFNIVSGN
jgi:hypothetical protein